MHGNHWKNFTAPISIKNLSQNNETNWEIRRNQFGCFTREELIDNSDYWNLVQALLARHTNLSFHYTGANQSTINGRNPNPQSLTELNFWLASITRTKLTEYAFYLIQPRWVTVIWLGRLLRLLSQLSIKRKASSRPHAPFINC